MSMADYTIQNQFELQEHQVDDLTILSARGRMEMSELAVIEAAFHRLAQDGRRRVIVDLTEVRTLSTLVVAGFVIRAESFHSNGGELTVTGASSLRNVFRMLDPKGKIQLQTDVVTAIKSMSQRTAQPETSRQSPKGH